MLTEVQWQVKSWGVAGAMFPPTFYIIITITTIQIIAITITTIQIIIITIIIIIIITNISKSLLTGIRTNYESICAVHHKWEQCERTRPAPAHLVYVSPECRACTSDFAADRFFISSSCICCRWKWWYCADCVFVSNDDDDDDCYKGEDHCSENMQLVKVQWIWLPSWNVSQRYKISPDPERTMILIQFLPVWSPKPLLLLRVAAGFNARLFFEVFFHMRIWGQDWNSKCILSFP